MNASQETEITLGTGKLLGLFFGLVIVCALFFGFGFTLGRGSAKQSGSLVSPEGAPVATTSASTKPGAGAQGKADCAAGADCSGQNPQDMTFYKSVEQKDAPTQLDASAQPQSQPAPFSTPPPAAPEMKPAVPQTVVGTGYMVQVAAVSKREDADLLRSALQAKQYPVVISNVATDKLFHVQVGPFADVKDAESMKSRLVSDGYNPILKR